MVFILCLLKPWNLFKALDNEAGQPCTGAPPGLHRSSTEGFSPNWLFSVTSLAPLYGVRNRGQCGRTFKSWHGWILGNFLLRNSGDAEAQAARGGGEVTIPRGVQEPCDLALRDVVSGCGVGCWLDMVIPEVFSNINDTTILWWAQYQTSDKCCNSTLRQEQCLGEGRSGGSTSQFQFPCMGFLCPGTSSTLRAPWEARQIC